MSLSQDKTLPRPYRRIAEEDRAWSHLYRSARDPAVAAEVVQHLHNDAEAARRHLALYLCCRQTLRAHKARIKRKQRIGRVLRRFINAIASTPAAVVRKLVRGNDYGSVKANSSLAAPQAVSRIRQMPGRIELAEGIPSPVEPSRVVATTTSAATGR